MSPRPRLNQPRGVDPNEKRLREIARLDRFDYEKRRKAEARKLGVRVEYLDTEYKKRREIAEFEQLRETVESSEVEPWPEPVNGTALLYDLFAVINRYCKLPAHASEAIALWIMHAHAHDAAHISPILFVSSPTPRCGKTTLLKVIRRLVPKPLMAGNVTKAVIYRGIEALRPTLLIDEADTYLTEDHELRGILDLGHDRDTASVPRIASHHGVEHFSTWAPKVVAGNKRLHPTLEDRSIYIPMARKKQSEDVARLRPSDSYVDLKRRCIRWVIDHINELREAQPELPTSLHDRAADNWEPLLAIADLVGEGWDVVARNAAVALTTEDNIETDSVTLLRDLRDLFGSAGAKFLASENIVEHLTKMEDRPWPEFRRGQWITKQQIATLLRPFGVKPIQIREGTDHHHRGYDLRDLQDAFERYL